MIKFENTEVFGWEHAIRGMRNPMNSWERSDSFNSTSAWETYRFGEGNPEIGPNDLDLMKRLRNGGPVHAKYRRMITVYVDITAPLYWWKEFDTYKVGTVSNSCSTMHKIHAKEFTIDDFSHEHLFNDIFESKLYCSNVDSSCNYKGALEVTIDVLNCAREWYLETKDKKYWWQMIQLLPSSYNQKRTIMMNFEVLANIYKSRKDHRLNEWREFCDWIKTLPYSELVTGDRNENLWIPCTDENAKMPEEGEEVLCTLKEDWSYGDEKDVQYHVFEGEYKTIKEDCYDMPAANGKGYFEAINDWDEGQPLSVIAWMPKPVPYKE